MNFFTVDILTPYAIVASNVPAESVLIPTIKGQINILAEHTHIISRLGNGVLSIFGSGSDPDRFFNITTGICKVLKEKIIVLSNVAEESFEVDEKRAQEALRNADDFLKKVKSPTDEEVAKYRRKIERAKIRLQLAQMVRKVSSTK